MSRLDEQHLNSVRQIVCSEFVTTSDIDRRRFHGITANELSQGWGIESIKTLTLNQSFDIESSTLLQSSHVDGLMVVAGGDVCNNLTSMDLMHF